MPGPPFFFVFGHRGDEAPSKRSKGVGVYVCVCVCECASIWCPASWLQYFSRACTFAFAVDSLLFPLCAQIGSCTGDIFSNTREKSIGDWIPSCSSTSIYIRGGVSCVTERVSQRIKERTMRLLLFLVIYVLKQQPGWLCVHQGLMINNAPCWSAEVQLCGCLCGIAPIHKWPLLIS